MASYGLRITPLASKGWLIHAHDRTGEEEQMDKLRQQGAVAVQDSTDKTLFFAGVSHELRTCLLYTSPSPRDKRQSRMPSSA